MDGVKSLTDIIDDKEIRLFIVVGRRTARAEAPA